MAVKYIQKDNKKIGEVIDEIIKAYHLTHGCLDDFKTKVLAIPYRHFTIEKRVKDYQRKFWCLKIERDGNRFNIYLNDEFVLGGLYVKATGYRPDKPNS